MTPREWAKKAAEQYDPKGYRPFLIDALEAAIASALSEQIERDARIAESEAHSAGDGPFASGYRGACEDIARAIRSQGGSGQ